MKRVISTAAVSALALSAAPAAAQVAMAPVGPRVEAIVGYDAPRVELEGIDDIKDDGVLYGVGVGYDFAVSPSISAGVDLEATESTADEDFSDGINTASLEAGRDLYAGGRLTFPVSNAANLYVKGGYTNFRVKGELNGDEEATTLDGWRVGAGGQFGIGGKAYVGGEYRYSDYENDVKRHQFALTLGTRF